jgi:hypothetical protein
MSDNGDSARIVVQDSALAGLFLRAAEIASVVPESMQAVAFGSALEKLANANGESVEGRGVNDSPKLTRARVKATDPEDAVSLALNQLDRTGYSRIMPGSRVLDNALWVLRAAKDQLGIDGLTPSQVADILTGKFRVATKASAANMALGRAGNMVDRIPRGRAFAYRIMAPGEAYLDSSSSS